jgi:hypothetical protein
MRMKLASLCVVAFTCLPAPAFAWAYPGHRIVGTIADLVLKAHHPIVYAKVQALLTIKADGKDVKRTLSEVAVFPDCAKNDKFCERPPSDEEKAYVARNPNHGAFHFTDVPIEERRYIADSAGTGTTDVVQMIEYAVAQLRGKSPAAKHDVKLTDPEAVWLLAHLVGDIHQPLHVGAKFYDGACRKGVDPNQAGEPPDFGIDKTVAETQGGNKILLTGKEPAVGPADQLHLYWDLTAVAQAMAAVGLHDSEPEFARLLAGKAPDGWKTPGDASTWASKWANEVIPVAAEAHRRLSIRRKGEPTRDHDGKLQCKWETTLDKSYQDWAREQARTQLAKAGFRLAALFVAIFPEEAKKDERGEVVTSPPPP